MAGLKFAFFVLLFSQDVKPESYIEKTCFETVTHYYSNPGVTGKSLLSYTYNNDRFHTVSVDLNCDNTNETLYIELESIKLSLPATTQGYCLEANKTEYTQCAAQSQCDCCQLPKERCFVAIEDIEDNKIQCDRQSNCTVNITSEFLATCPGRQYDCENQKCHSRWVDVKYSCKEEELIPLPTTVPPTQIVPASSRFPWWVIIVVIVVVLVPICAVIFYRKCKQRDEYDHEYDVEQKVSLKHGIQESEPKGPDGKEIPEYAVINRDNKKKKPGNCDAADVTKATQERNSVTVMEPNTYYESADVVRPDTQETDTYDEVKRRPTVPKKPAPGVPNSGQNGAKPEPDDTKPPARLTKPKTAPPVPPGNKTGQRLTPTEGQKPPPKPPRLSDTELPKSDSTTNV